ncbi:hypothetical protein L486_04194 [Kwoniella mangroviensis CBS 10435]|uniref:Uncharacterized protein n=1 Tax=Kwoniella mangroviensis CBS 10435 TaxID=1331196 RepID=A0A1B9IRV8_9TREE|nr:hypothetical protein L486_04194 [Kwoniella mangroviensis CBS 10435]
MSVFKKEFYDDESIELPADLEERFSEVQKGHAALTSEALRGSQDAQNAIDDAIQNGVVSLHNRDRLTYDGNRLLRGMMNNFLGLVYVGSKDSAKLTEGQMNNVKTNLEIIENKMQSKSERWRSFFEDTENPLVELEIGTKPLLESLKGDGNSRKKPAELTACWAIKHTIDDLLSDLEVRRSMSEFLSRSNAQQLEMGQTLRRLTTRPLRSLKKLNSLERAMEMMTDWKEDYARYLRASQAIGNTLNGLYPKLSEEEIQKGRSFADEFRQGSQEFVENLEHEHLMGICGYRELPLELVNKYGDDEETDEKVRAADDQVVTILRATRLDDLRSFDKKLKIGWANDEDTAKNDDDTDDEDTTRRKTGESPVVRVLPCREGTPAVVFLAEDLGKRARKMNYTLNITDNPSRCISDMKILIQEGTAVAQSATKQCNSFICSDRSLKSVLPKNEYRSLDELQGAVSLLGTRSKKKSGLKLVHHELKDMYNQLSETVSSCRTEIIDNTERLISEAEAGARYIEESNLTEMYPNDRLVNLAEEAFSAKSKLDLNHLYRLKSMISGNVLDSEGKPLPHMSRKTRFSLQRKYDSYKKAMSKTPFKDVQSISDLEFTLEEMGDWQENDEANLTSALHELTVSEDQEEGADTAESSDDRPRKYTSWAAMLRGSTTRS